MKCCPHVDALYKKKNSSPIGPESTAGNFDHLERLYKLIIELNNSGKAVTQENGEPRVAYLKCSGCDQFSRLYICAHCLAIYCLPHIQQHSRLKAHPLCVEISYAAVYCHVCRDFQYNRLLEEFVRELFLKESFFPFGKFSEWQPSQKNLDLLKKNFDQHQQQQQQLTSLSTLAGSHHQHVTFKIKRSSIIGLRGLINLGNTCFMNCILQTLTHIPSLRDYFLGDQHYCNHRSRVSSDADPASTSTNQSNHNNGHGNGKNICLVCELVTLFQEFYSGKRSPYIPYNLLHQVWTQVKHLAGYEQQDAHEFFIAALNSIHKNCIENDQICINLNKNRKKFLNYNNCNCIIDKIFTGGLQSDVICSNCNHVSTTVDPFWDISLDLYKNSNKSVKSLRTEDALRLEDCLLKFTQPEILTSFNCSKCKCSREAHKQFTMKKLPVVCCFHLKRFEQSNRIHKKIFDHISFPEILDMSPFMSPSSQAKSNCDEEPLLEAERKLGCGKFDSNKYFLFAVVNHHGTLESGHYTSYIRLKNDQWFKCDDHVISRAALSDVMSSEGYLLFYHKLWNDFE